LPIELAIVVGALSEAIHEILGCLFDVVMREVERNPALATKLTQAIALNPGQDR
jgi:hypothetical protein